MTTTDRRTQPLSDDGVQAMLALMKGSDTVELKLTVPDEGHRWTINALALDPIAAQIRQVFFLDTPDLSLNKIGVVVRARRVQGKSADSVVKLRPVSHPSCRMICVVPPPSEWRSTRCRAGTCARHRSKVSPITSK